MNFPRRVPIRLRIMHRRSRENRSNQDPSTGSLPPCILRTYLFVYLSTGLPISAMDLVI